MIVFVEESAEVIVSTAVSTGQVPDLVVDW